MTSSQVPDVGHSKELTQAYIFGLSWEGPIETASRIWKSKVHYEIGLTTPIVIL